jgi:hypothetical protein
MAGNTKLLGFGPDFNHPGKYILKLARWGGEAIIEVEKGLVVELGRVCREVLPTKPRQSENLGKDFDAHYDPTYGIVGVKMSVPVAEKVAEMLNYYSCDHQGVKFVEDVMAYSTALHECVQDHRDYLNATGEPGVEDTH